MFFGSARVDSRERATRAPHFAPAACRMPTSIIRGKLNRSRKAVEWARFYEDARELSRLVTEWARSLPGENHRFVVTSGGGPGIMEAANRGAREAGGRRIGSHPPALRAGREPTSPKACISSSLLLHAEVLVRVLAKALVIFPEGSARWTNSFEILTLVQTDKLSKKIEIIPTACDARTRFSISSR